MTLRLHTLLQGLDLDDNAFAMDFMARRKRSMPDIWAWGRTRPTGWKDGAPATRRSHRGALPYRRLSLRLLK